MHTTLQKIVWQHRQRGQSAYTSASLYDDADIMQEEEEEEAAAADSRGCDTMALLLQGADFCK